MKTVVIAGGSGLIGRHLSELLMASGYEVLWLSRKANPKARFATFAWNPSDGTMDETPLERADFVINLAGSGIVDSRWTARTKQEIIDSRVQSADLIAQFLTTKKHNIKAYIGASAIGFYGHRGDEWLYENMPSGNGFLAESTLAWERGTEQVAATGVRTATLRIGIVLSKLGGALPKMLMSFNFLMGFYFGSGKQHYSWIHIEDMARMFQFALENESVQGIYNAVAPKVVDNKTLTRNVGVALGRPALLLPAPAFALRLLMGEMSTVILNSVRVSSHKIEAAGFQFLFPESVAALRDVLRRKI
jgi:uncharacterized protein